MWKAHRKSLAHHLTRSPYVQPYLQLQRFRTVTGQQKRQGTLERSFVRWFQKAAAAAVAAAMIMANGQHAIRS